MGLTESAKKLDSNECVSEGKSFREQARITLVCCYCAELFSSSRMGLPETRFLEFGIWVD